MLSPVLGGKAEGCEHSQPTFSRLRIPAYLPTFLKLLLQVSDCISRDNRALAFWSNASNALVGSFSRAVLILEENSDLGRLHSDFLQPKSDYCSDLASSNQDQLNFHQVSIRLFQRDPAFADLAADTGSILQNAAVSGCLRVGQFRPFDAADNQRGCCFEASEGRLVDCFFSMTSFSLLRSC